MIRVGLTGSIGSGKSSVSSYLKFKGIPIIDADIISREIYDIYPKIQEKLLKAFGYNFFNEDKSLKRRELGNYIFKYKDKKKILEDIVIPYIKKEIFLRIDSLEEEGYNICVLDAPILIENNLHKKMDYNILIYCREDIQIERVMKRDNLSYEEVRWRIDSQASLEEKKKKVQFIVDNSYDISYTYEKINQIFRYLGENL